MTNNNPKIPWFEALVRGRKRPLAFQLQKRQPPCLSPLEAFSNIRLGLIYSKHKIRPKPTILVGSTSRQVDEERRVTVSSNNNNNNNNNSSNNNNHGRSKSRSQSRFFYLFAADCFFKGSHERSWLPDCELSKSFRCFERVQATPSPFCNWCWVRYLLINTNEQLELTTRQQVILHLPHLGSCSSSWCLEFEP